MSQPEANSAPDSTVPLPDSWQAELARRAATTPAPVDERIAVIEDSLRCFTYGWLSCVPLLGVVYLYPAVRRFNQARRRQVEWNPARGYLSAGLALASLGWMICLLTWWAFISAQAAVVETDSDDGLMNFLPAVLFFGSPPAVAGLVVTAVSAWKSLADACRRFLWLVVVFGLGCYLSAGLALASDSSGQFNRSVLSCSFTVGH